MVLQSQNCLSIPWKFSLSKFATCMEDAILLLFFLTRSRRHQNGTRVYRKCKEHIFLLLILKGESLNIHRQFTYHWGSAWGFRETGRLPFLFLGRGEISLFLLGRREIGLILGRFYLQGEGRLGFLILGRGEISRFNFRERGDWTPPCIASMLNMLKMSWMSEFLSELDFEFFNDWVSSWVSLWVSSWVSSWRL